MKVVVLGTRGFPDVQGGVEKHCENLYPELVKKGCEVIVFSRAPYVDPLKNEYKGVKLVPLKCPRSKYLEAFVHTFKGVLAARKIKPGLLHIHAVGPSLFVPFAEILGLKTVMTHHGPDYERKKWKGFAKTVLRWGEKNGCKRARAVICVSETIAADVRKKFGRDVEVIPNGVIIPQKAEGGEILERLRLKKGQYILAVARFVPEKGIHDLIEAFKVIRDQSALDWKLAIAGDADHEDEYSRNLKIKAGSVKGVVLSGFLSGKPLEETYSHAGIFVLPSYYEGLPIVLLEAMSYGLSCIASDISANKEVGLGEERLFKPGDIEELAEKIKEFIGRPLGEDEKKKQIEMIRKKYDWEKIAEKTMGVYGRVG
jgi:glycosyltransferase involved in cell wall biosynthesis